MLKLLILLVIVVSIIAVAQLAKVYRLSAELRGRREEDISEADTKLQGSLFIVFMVLLFATTIGKSFATATACPLLLLSTVSITTL